MSASIDLTSELEPLRAMLAADGYGLAPHVSTDGRRLVLEITATPEACAECLVSPRVIAAVAYSCLATTSSFAQHEIDVRLPPPH